MVTAIQTPFDKHNLVATKNMLRIDANNLQFIETSNTELNWTGSNEIFGGSLIFQVKSLNANVSLLISKRGDDGAAGRGYYIFLDSIGNITFGFNTLNAGNTLVSPTHPLIN